MFNIATEKSYMDGELIFKEGSSGDWIYIVISGAVEISRTIEGKKLNLAVLKSEDVFGELSFFSGSKRTTTAIAVGNTTLGLLDRHSLDHEFNRLPGDFRTIIINMAKRYEVLIDEFSKSLSATDNSALKMLSLTFKDPQAFDRAYTNEYSKGGLFIKTKNPLKKGEKILLKLQLPDLTKPVKIKSEVEWTRRHSDDPANFPPGMRIKFSETDENIKHIENYVKKINLNLYRNEDRNE
ncbi:MAG: cyclic nucleotide-binding domain-containing protein [Deltaproteobacteria bacterium]|nr:cyclic nucleotide-binding domain-containing protein [Deltaproteobacteria bacterium]